MKTFRFPLADSSGSVTKEAQAALGNVNIAGHCGRDFMVNIAGQSDPVRVSLLGDACFIPAHVPESLVLEIESILAPLVESETVARAKFLSEVFRLSDEPGQDQEQTVADEFCRALRALLSPDTLAEVLRRNRAEPNAHVCHTHDFCDANEVMAGAFAQAVGRPMDPGSDKDMTLSDRGWTIAKAAGFALGASPRT